MKIGVITFVSDPQFEDLIIETLIGGDLPDFYLELRAITFTEVLHAQQRFEEDSIPRVIITDMAGDGLSRRDGLTILRLDSKDELSRQQIMVAVSSAIRNQVSETTPRALVKPKGKLSVVTGTTASPGISTIAMNLAYELARDQVIRLVDADARRSDLAFLLGGKPGKDVVNLSTKLSIAQSTIHNPDTWNIVDCGAALDLGSALSDRRESAREFCNYLEAANRVIFVFQPENNLMYELERFLEAEEREILRTRPIFVINKVGDSQRQRSIQKRALARIGNFPVISAPLDRSTLERSKSQYSPIAEVAPRSKLRRSIKELAELLIE